MSSFRQKFSAFFLSLTCAGSLLAAPLFPDLVDDQWAKDAVATLAARGLVEGYPDGTFKGDRSASRWETAILVARLLAKMESAKETFAARDEVEVVRQLALALREELESLGVRVTNLEHSVGNLDRRVTELERISFYGSVQSRVSFHSFYNRANTSSDPTNPLLNYDLAVGSAFGAGGLVPGGPAAGLPFDPFAFGAFTVTNLDKGTPLISGTGLTSLATLGLNITVTDEVDARVEFKAFSAQGSQLNEFYYGVSAPYLSNTFTGQGVSSGLSGLQPLNHQPFTRMTLDHFWVHHKPSNIRIRLGALSDLKMDPLVYQRQYNPGAFAPALLDSYGFQITGQHDIAEGQNLSWETLGTLLPDRNLGLNQGAYFNQAWGANLAYNFAKDRGKVKLNFLRATQEASGGLARQVGLTSPAFNPTPWVNPSGFYANQLLPQQRGGIGSLHDVRPIPMSSAGNDGAANLPGISNFGAFGPQAQDNYGLSAHYNWGGALAPYLKGEYAHTVYQPNQDSSYSTTGDAYRVAAGAAFLEQSLALDLEYLSVDPNFDPFVLQVPSQGILFNAYRFGEAPFNMRGDLYSLHDTAVYPHNREGFRGKLQWNFAPEGTIGLRVGRLNQKEASLQDVRFSTSSLAPGTPNSPVLGFSPGFVEPVFGGLSPFTFAPVGGNTLAGVLEAPRGRVDSWSLDGKYRWTVAESSPEAEDFWSRGLTLTAGFHTTEFRRRSNLRALLPGPNGVAGESVNNVDLEYTSWGASLEYDLTPTFAVNAGYSEFILKGHYDPYGVYSAFAVASNDTDFDSFNLRQSQPTVGFNYAVSEAVDWDLAAIFLRTDDRVSSAVFSTPVIPGTNTFFSPQRGIHPFSYEGIMVNSSFTFNF